MNAKTKLSQSEKVDKAAEMVRRSQERRNENAMYTTWQHVANDARVAAAFKEIRGLAVDGKVEQIKRISDDMLKVVDALETQK
jgi:hypothetical protein